ncbi:DUF257 family protein [Thermococcus atlanticus]
MRVVFETLWDSIIPGEVVIMERLSPGLSYIGLYDLVTWGIRKGYSILIVDVMDSLHLYRAKMELAGLNAEVLDDVEVIKIGGMIETGRVRYRIDETSEPRIMMQKFRMAYDSILGERKDGISLVISVGMDKLFLTPASSGDVLTIISALHRYVGDRRRIAVYMLKVNVLAHVAPYVIDLMEDLGTTIIRVSRKGRQAEFNVVKAINREIMGLTVKI